MDKGDKTGKVYLVGAGPGDPGLITVKGARCLAEAEVIIYDRPVNPALLGYACSQAELICAGTSPGHHPLDQQKICQLLLEKTREQKVVVRLYGGDPFVFSSGGEEGEFLQAHGIPFQVVPGVPSATAVPAYAGIPATHGSLASSLAVVAGSRLPAPAQLAEWTALAHSADTLVFLMGRRNLPLIVEKLVQCGRPAGTPVALIKSGTRPEQSTLVGTLGDITQQVELVGLTHPVTIVVGAAVKLRGILNWYECQPLFGKRVVITRARGQARSFSQRIEALGGEAWEFPAISIAPPLDYSPLDQAVQGIRQYDWVIFTSVNGVEAFFGRFRLAEKDIRDLYSIRLCAIGPNTMEALEKLGLNVEQLPEKFVAESLIAKFSAEDMRNKRVLLPRANIARKLLPQELRRMGAVVDEAEAYRTLPGSGDVERLRLMLRKGAVHVVTFTSSSTVKNFAEMLGAETPDLLAGVTVACIGPITAETARALGLHVDVLAAEYTVDGLTAAMTKHFLQS